MTLDEEKNTLSPEAKEPEEKNAQDAGLDAEQEAMAAEQSEDELSEVEFQKGKLAEQIKRPDDAPEEFTRAIYDVPVTVRVVLGQSRMSVEELVTLKRGEIVTLNKKAGELVDVFVNDRLIARGEIVLVDGSLGITLTELASERVN